MLPLLRIELELLLLLLLGSKLLLLGSKLLLLGSKLLLLRSELLLLGRKLLLLGSKLLLLRSELLLLRSKLLLLGSKLLLLLEGLEVLIEGRLVKLSAERGGRVEVGGVEDGSAGSRLVGEGLPLNRGLILRLHLLLPGDHADKRKNVGGKSWINCKRQRRQIFRRCQQHRWKIMGTISDC